MPRSKKRRRRVAEQQKNLDRARKLIQKEEQKAVLNTTSDTNPDFDSVDLKEANNNAGGEVNSLSSNTEEESHKNTDEVHVGGWLSFGSLYTGIHAGIIQVCSERYI